MSDTPQITALRTLQETFSTVQIQQIANACVELRDKGGWGEIVVKFDNGKPNTLAITITRKINKDQVRV